MQQIIAKLTSLVLGLSLIVSGNLRIAQAAGPKIQNESDGTEYLVKLKNSNGRPEAGLKQLQALGPVERLTDQWVKVTTKQNLLSVQGLQSISSEIEYVQPNYRVQLIENFQAKDQNIRNWAANLSRAGIFIAPPPADNPPIPNQPNQSVGEDPLYSRQWGMIDNQVKEAWRTLSNSIPSVWAPKELIVAVIDTGVDYTHEDLVGNMWRNPGESGLDSQGRSKENNGFDDDNNGYIDDIVGWDFAANDNKPFDLAVDPMKLLAGGGNPGHGTHCAGNVAAAANNGKGVVGVAPGVKIMALRFLSEKGQGTTGDAIKAIRYAVDNGAIITSNSWGSEGEDPNDNKENLALREAIQYSMDKGTLFIAAAGNGHQGAGYDNDTDAKPGYPASYDHENIISVAALDNQDRFGSFSNWGRRTVDLGAPGVRIFSTTVGSQYSDMIFDKFGITVSWDGTSMATPHVSGAAALYWSVHPELNWKQVKEAILKSSKPVPQLKDKLVTGGKLDVLSLIKMVP